MRKKEKQIWKRLFSLFLVISIIVSIQPGYVQAASSYTADWQRWSQGASGYSAMQYGCRVTAYAKMLAEAGYGGFGNPDGFFEWGKARGYFRASDTYELKTSAPVTYVNSNGGTASLVGRQALSGNNKTDSNTVMNLINQGYYIVLTGSAHSVYIGRADSISQGTPVILDSWASRTVGPSFQYRNYTQYTFKTANYFSITDNSIHNPVGYYDSANGGTGKVRITGWAYDPDDLTQSIPIHVYIGGPAGVGEGHAITANVPRQDVDNVHHVGVYHGFDAVIQTSRSGLQPIYIYAINIGAGDNSCLGSMTTNITADTTAPTISDIRVTDVNSEGYTIICRVEDEGSVAKVQFPTWTTYGDQDDLMASWWNNAACRGTQNGTTWSYRVNTSDHNNEEGFYNTHIYAYDAAGNSSCAMQNGIYIDRTPPTISDVQVTDIDATGYTVTCKVEDASSDIMKVQFPTWTTKNDQDDLAPDWINNPVCRGTNNGTTWSYRVNDRDHNYERGEYRTHIYAWDSFGNCASSSQGLNHIEFQNTYREVSTVFYNGHTYRLYNDCLSWDEAKVKCEELGGHLATITSQEEQDVVAGLIKELTREGYWLGGWKNGESLWVTGEEFSYSNWYPGEPNALYGEDRYSIYADCGKWNDFSNTYKGLGFICEWEDKDDKNDRRENPIAVGPGNVRLLTTSVTWNGKERKPFIIATDSQGRPISHSDYTVSYSNNQNIGQATATISFKNNYTGTIKKTFTIKPKGTSITKLTARKKGFTAKWKKQKSQNAGHEIQYATNSKFKSAKTDYINANTASQKFTRLKAKKKYYVRIRTYKYAWVDGRYTKLCSAWSKAKTVVTKR